MLILALSIIHGEADSTFGPSRLDERDQSASLSRGRSAMHVQIEVESVFHAMHEWSQHVCDGDKDFWRLATWAGP